MVSYSFFGCQGGIKTNRTQKCKWTYLSNKRPSTQNLSLRNSSFYTQSKELFFTELFFVDGRLLLKFVQIIITQNFKLVVMKIDF